MSKREYGEILSDCFPAASMLTDDEWLDVRAKCIHKFLLMLFPYLKGLPDYLEDKFVSHSPLFILPDFHLGILVFNCDFMFVAEVITPWIGNWRASVVDGPFSPVVTVPTSSRTEYYCKILLPMTYGERDQYLDVRSYVQEAQDVGQRFLQKHASKVF